MNKLLAFLGVIAITVMLCGAGFNPGEYPGIYNSYKSQNALVQSDVISTRLSNYGACEFANNSAAPAWFMLYNSATVAGQTNANMISFCYAPAGQPCSVYAAGPSGPAINAAIVAGNGLSWFASSGFPTQSGIGASGFVICTVN